jgi:CheY-specific phosphatase CheX
MTAAAGTGVSAEDLRAVAPSIWEMMLGLPLRPEEVDEDPFADVASMTGLVTIAGGWSGAVQVQCSQAAAEAFAAAMFAVDEVDADEVRDAMAELTNMTGGGMKNLLPEGCQLGIPTVTAGVGYRVDVPRTVVVERFGYLADAGPVVVTVRRAA